MLNQNDNFCLIWFKVSFCFSFFKLKKLHNHTFSWNKTKIVVLFQNWFEMKTSGSNWFKISLGENQNIFKDFLLDLSPW